MNKGFTLIEIIVAATIFSIVISAVSSLLVMSLRGQRNIFIQQNLVDNTRFALEQMSRQIRMAQSDETGVCTGTAGAMYSSGGTSLSFIDYQNPGNCLTYELSGTKIKKQSDTGQPFVDLTADDININRLNFIVHGRDVRDSEQARVTIVIEAEGANQSAGGLPGILLQTTISARNIDVL